MSLSKALYKVRSGCNSASQAPQHTATLKSSDHTVGKKNAALREQIIDLIEKDKFTPFCYDQLNIDDLISTIDPTVWSFINNITKSTSECRGTSKPSKHSSHVNVSFAYAY